MSSGDLSTVQNCSSVEYEETGPRYSESYLARIDRYQQAISRTSNASTTRSIEPNETIIDADRIVITAPCREFVEEDDKEAENILIPDRFSQPESPTLANTEIADLPPAATEFPLPLKRVDVIDNRRTDHRISDYSDTNKNRNNSFSNNDNIIINATNTIKKELIISSGPQFPKIERQNSEEKELNFGGLGPIIKTTNQDIKESNTNINTNRPRTSGWAKLLASTLQRSRSTATTASDSLQKMPKFRPNRKSEQSAATLMSSAAVGHDNEVSDSAAVKMEMRKKKRSLGVDMREKLNFFRKAQSDGITIQSTTTSSTSNRSSLTTPSFLMNPDDIWKNLSGPPTREQVLSWGQSFENLLYDQHGISLFFEFLRSEFSDENLEFWAECQAYRTIVCPKKMQEKATQIFEDFVAEQSPREINLDSVTKVHTAAEILNATVHSFDQSQKKIQALMEKDSYQRFLRSELYHNVLNQHNLASSVTVNKTCTTNSSNSDQTMTSRVSYIPGLLPKVASATRSRHSRTNTNPSLLNINPGDTSKMDNQTDPGHRSVPSSPKSSSPSALA